MTAPLTKLPVSRTSRCATAFSLVEVVMAIGIASFALLTTLGLLANGYTTASEARNRANGSAIASRVFALVADEIKAGNDPRTSLNTYEEHFDSEGLPLGSTTSMWAYRSMLKFFPVSLGSHGENHLLFRAEVQIESRRQTQKLNRYFVSRFP